MQSNSVREIWGDFEEGQRLDDAASEARDLAAAELACEMWSMAYDRFAYAVPHTKDDVVFKLEQCARWITALEGSTAEWPGLQSCVDRLNEARALLEAGVEDIRPVALVRSVWREMECALGESYIDTIMVRTTLAGLMQGKALRVV